MKKHIDNHLNPHSSKGRRAVNNNTNSVLNAANLTNTIAAVASGTADVLATSKTSSNFLAMDVNKNNISPRMTPIVKHELYFPQCYGLPFNQPFPGAAVGTPLIQDISGSGVANGSTGSEVDHVNNNNSGEASPTGVSPEAAGARGEEIFQRKH